LRLTDSHAKNRPLFFSDLDIAPDDAKNSGRFLACKFEQRNSVRVVFFQITEEIELVMDGKNRICKIKICNQLFWPEKTLLDL